MSVRVNVLVGKCLVREVSFGEVSGRGILRSGKYPSGKCPSGKCQSGICPQGSVSRGSVRSGNCSKIVVYTIHSKSRTVVNSTSIFQWELSIVCQTRSSASKFSQFKLFRLCYMVWFWKSLEKQTARCWSLKQGIIKEWRDHSQEIIDNSIDSFRKRLRQIIKTDSGYIEH